MPLVFKPAVYAADGTLYELPRPVPVVRIQDAWDYRQFKVPLRAGMATCGHSQNGVDVALEGQVGSRGGAAKLSELEMLDEIERLRTALHVADAGARYLFFLYHDDASATYRHFRDCTTVRFDFDLSNSKLYTYSALIHADDPVLYTTGPPS